MIQCGGFSENYERYNSSLLYSDNILEELNRRWIFGDTNTQPRTILLTEVPEVDVDAEEEDLRVEEEHELIAEFEELQDCKDDFMSCVD